MTPLFKKLNFKNHPIVHIPNAPEEFEQAQEEMQAFTEIKNSLRKGESISFILVFVKSEKEISEWAEKVDALLVEDGVFWMAYPKKTSKKYKVDINRDYGWQALGKLGYEGVRQVAIDDDWSALRFRKAENIKNMSRDYSWRMSEEGKNKK